MSQPTSDRIQLHIKFNDKVRMNYSVKKDQMLGKLMNRCSRGVPMKFFCKGKLLDQNSTVESANLVNNDTIDAVPFEMANPNPQQSISSGVENQPQWQRATSVAFKRKVPLSSAAVGRETIQTETSSTNESSIKDETKAETDYDTDSNAAKIAKLQPQVENFLQKWCEFGTDNANKSMSNDIIEHAPIEINFREAFQTLNATGYQSALEELKTAYANDIHRLEQSERIKVQMLEAEIRSLQKQCEHDKVAYMDALKASTEKQNETINLMEEDFKRKTATLRDQEKFCLNEMATMKERLEQVLQKSQSIHQQQMDSAKNGYEAKLFSAL